MTERKLPLCRLKSHAERATFTVALADSTGRSAFVVCDECAKELAVGQKLADGRTIQAVTRAA